MAQSALQGLGDEEFMEAWTELAQKVEEDRETLRVFSHEHQRRMRMAQLKLEPGDLELLQGTEPAGIESEEAVNTNG